MNETGGDSTETLFEGATLRLGLISAVHLSNDPLHHCNEATIVLLRTFGFGDGLRLLAALLLAEEEF